MKFTHDIKSPMTDTLLETITFELHEHATLDEVLETLTRFVRACGYYFEGSIEIVDHEAEFNNYSHDYLNDPVVDELDEIDDDAVKANAAWPFPTSAKP